MPRLLVVLIVLAVLAIACGDGEGTENPPTGEPSASSAPAQTNALIQHYMRLGEARQLLADMGLEGVTMAPDRYSCIQDSCPDEPPGDDSYGCLSLLPTGDPANAESLLPEDPPRWWSVAWRGAFGESYSAPPEPVVNEPKAGPEPGEELVCGADVSRRMTAAAAVEFLAEAGLAGDWEQNPESPERTCPPGSDCPIPGAPAGATGCLDISIFELPRSAADPSTATVTVYVNFGFEDAEAYASYSIHRLLEDAEPAGQQGAHEDCIGIWARHPTNPYDSVPYTEVIQPAYWHLVATANGKTLQLRVASGPPPCDLFERVEVQETAEAVTINAFIRHAPSSCGDLPLNWHEAAVELDEPLGARQLLGCAPEGLWYLDHDRDCAQIEGT